MGLYNTSEGGLPLDQLPDLPPYEPDLSLEDFENRTTSNARPYQLPSSNLEKGYKLDQIKRAINEPEEEIQEIPRKKFVAPRALPASKPFPRQEIQETPIQKPALPILIQRPIPPPIPIQMPAPPPIEYIEPSEEIQEIEEQRLEPMLREPPEFEENLELRYRKKEPVYIRIDKFEAAMGVLGEIMNKIGEIEQALENTKQLKMEEEIEMEQWEREINHIKSRLNSIDKNIFEKFD